MSDWAVCYEKAIRDDGSLLFPERLTHEFLAQARRTMGSYLFANQYQNEIIPEGEKKFKKEWVRFWSTIPDRVLTFAFIDPAIGQEKIHDYTALVVVSVDLERNWYVRHASRQRITPSQIIELCFDVNARWSPSVIGIESVAFQQALSIFAAEEAKRRGINLPVTPVPRSGDKTKEMRILSLVPRFEWGTLFLAPNLHDLELELSQFPRGRHDDLCFVAGTKVLCANGEKEIQDIVPGDLVVTPLGLDRVTHTSHSTAPTVRYGNLVGTADHPIWTWEGIQRLDAFPCAEVLSSFSCVELIRWASLSAWSSMEPSLSGWAARDFITYLSLETTLIAGKPLGFTSLFISFIQEKKFLKAAKFTIRTAIRSITALKTWSVYRLRSTLNTLAVTLRKWPQTLIGFVTSRKPGTHQKKVLSGTGKLASAFGSISHGLKSVVSFVESVSKHRFQPELMPVLCRVSKGLDTKTNQNWNQSNASFVSAGSKNANGLKQKPAQQNAATPIFVPVYNLRTEKHHLFYANGILVSNCDALASIEDIVHYPSAQRRRNEAPAPNHPGYEKWYRENLLRRS